jgi:putative ABC transport system ATP-binding protein
MTAALEYIDVDKSYGSGPTHVRALSCVSFAVAPGEFVSVRGPSGCGKSTLLHLGGGLDMPTGGRVLVNGNDLATLDAADLARLRRRSVGYVFQRLNLVPALSAIENVMLPLELDGIARRPARERARAALDAAGLFDDLDRYPDELSGGEQQRIAIARAVAAERRLLLADEPTGALDSVSGDAVMELLAGLPASHGTAIVLVTHEPRYAAWADRVISLRDGHVVDIVGTTPSVIANGATS